MYSKFLEKMLHENPGMTIMRMEVLMDKYALAPIGLSGIYAKILMVVMSQKKAYQKEIVNFVSTTPANISQRLEKMEKDGLIKRELEGDKKDRRKVIISITNKGRLKFMHMTKRMLVIQSFIKSKFSKKEWEERQKSNRILKSAVDELEGKADELFK